jgi:MFS family permease
VRKLGLSPGVIGAVLTAGNVGFLVGAFLSQRTSRRFGPGPALIGGASLIGLGAVFLPLATPSTALAMLVAFGLIATFGGVVYNVNARSLMQSVTPERLLGRTLATGRFIVWGTIPIGAFLGGVFGSHIGLRPTLWVAAAGTMLGFIPPLLSPVRRLSVMPELTPGPLPAPRVPPDPLPEPPTPLPFPPQR